MPDTMKITAGGLFGGCGVYCSFCALFTPQWTSACRTIAFVYSCINWGLFGVKSDSGSQADQSYSEAESQPGYTANTHGLKDAVDGAATAGLVSLIFMIIHVLIAIAALVITFMRTQKDGYKTTAAALSCCASGTALFPIIFWMALAHGKISDHYEATVAASANSFPGGIEVNLGWAMVCLFIVIPLYFFQALFMYLCDDDQPQQQQQMQTTVIVQQPVVGQQMYGQQQMPMQQQPVMVQGQPMAQ